MKKLILVLSTFNSTEISDLVSGINSADFISAFAAVFSILIYFSATLAENIPNLVPLDMQEILSQNTENVIMIHDANFFYSALIADTLNLRDAFGHDFSVNIGSAHLIIFHGLEERILLVTINENYGITIHAQCIVNSLTTNFEEVDENLRSAFNQIISERGHMPLKLTIFIDQLNPEIIGTIWTTNAPYIPLKDYFATNEWRLFMYVFEYHRTWVNIYDVPNNLDTVVAHIQNINNMGESILNNLSTVTNEDQIMLDREYRKGLYQCIRYLEAIHKIYADISPLDTAFTQAEE